MHDVGQSLFLAIPCLALDVMGRGRAGDAVRFTARADTAVEGPDVAAREANCGSVVVRADFPSARVADAFAPLLDTAAALVALADTRDRHAPARPTAVEPAPPRRRTRPRSSPRSGVSMPMPPASPAATCRC